MKYDFVVARYNEDIKWIEGIDTSDTNIFLYNKGNDDIPVLFPKPFTYKKLKNIGRDPHSYIYHIVENWENLPEYVIFTQGNPFDHCSNLFDKIKSHTSEDFLYLHSTRILREEISCGWEQKVFDQRDDKEGIFQFFRLADVAKRLLGDEMPKFFMFAPGQQFIASKKSIFKRGLNYYQEILNDFDKNYLLPWTLERLWPYILRAENYE